jgi:hypothetical protein
MAEFFVSWTTMIEADSKEEAAKKAFREMLDYDPSDTTTMIVQLDGDETEYAIDVRTGKTLSSATDDETGEIEDDTQEAEEGDDETEEGDEEDDEDWGGFEDGEDEG